MIEVVAVSVSGSTRCSSGSGNTFWVSTMCQPCAELLFSYLNLFLQVFIALPHQKQTLELRHDVGLEMNIELVIFFFNKSKLLSPICCAGGSSNKNSNQNSSTDSNSSGNIFWIYVVCSPCTKYFSYII